MPLPRSAPLLLVRSGADPRCGGSTPDGGGSTPDGGGSTPDGGGSTPDGGGSTPDGGGSTPDGGGNTPRRPGAAVWGRKVPLFHGWAPLGRRCGQGGGGCRVPRPVTAPRQRPDAAGSSSAPPAPPASARRAPRGAGFRRTGRRISPRLSSSLAKEAEELQTLPDLLP